MGPFLVLFMFFIMFVAVIFLSYLFSKIKPVLAFLFPVLAGIGSYNFFASMHNQPGFAGIGLAVLGVMVAVAGTIVLFFSFFFFFQARKD